MGIQTDQQLMVHSLSWFESSCAMVLKNNNSNVTMVVQRFSSQQTAISKSRTDSKFQLANQKKGSLGIRMKKEE
jgi:hypothetical protein